MQGSSSLKRKRVVAQLAVTVNVVQPGDPRNRNRQLEIKHDPPARGDPVPGFQLVSASIITFLSVRIKRRRGRGEVKCRVVLHSRGSEL